MEFRQLAGAEQAVAVHQVRRVDLDVAVLLRVHVEHELGERAVQARHGALHQREARPADLRRGVEVEAAEFGAEVDMVLRGKAEFARRAPAPDFHVVGLRLAGRHALVRQVGNHRDESIDAVEEIGERLLVALQLVAEAGDFLHHGSGVLALGLQLADLFRQGVALRLQFLGTHLQALALIFQRLEGHHVETGPAAGEAFGHLGRLAAQKLYVEHDFSCSTSTKCRAYLKCGLHLAGQSAEFPTLILHGKIIS